MKTSLLPLNALLSSLLLGFEAAASFHPTTTGPAARLRRPERSTAPWPRPSAPFPRPTRWVASPPPRGPSAVRASLGPVDDDGAGVVGEDDGPRRGRRAGLRRRLRSVARLFARLVARFRDRARVDRIVAVLTVAWLCFGLGGGTTAATARRPMGAPAAPAPLEMPFSGFLDCCEGRHPAGYRVASDGVRIGLEGGAGGRRLEYRLLRNDEGKAGAGAQKPEDAAATPVPARTVSVMETPDLVRFLRAHRIEFEAASGAAAAKKVGGSGEVDGLATAAVLFAAYKLYGRSGGPSLFSPSGNSQPGRLAGGKKKRNKAGAEGSAAAVATTTFDDVRGIDDAKRDVLELVDVLRRPGRYALTGARAPAGILLEGPPGCGKTTLARAAAAFADVPLLHCSGSDFVETYVGKGAARVRGLFDRARAIDGPCLVFIDEIDALGKARRGGGSGSSDEAEQTLNALLTCMDGLDNGGEDGAAPVCVLAATNQAELLDGALLRPGRFDRLVRVSLPDAAGRESILRGKCARLPSFDECVGVDPRRRDSLGVGEAVDLSAVAAVTPGASGADLECIVNEAAIRAARRVGAQLDGGAGEGEVDPRVRPEDFEDSVRCFFEARGGKRKGGILDGGRLQLL